MKKIITTRTARTNRSGHLWWMATALFFVFCLTMLFTSGAFFTDNQTAGNNTSLVFGTVSVNVPSGLTFTTAELLPGNSNIVRTVSFTNNGTVDSYLRFSCAITINGDPITKTKTVSGDDVTVEFLTFAVNNAWEQHGSYYFYGSVEPEVTVTATLTFSINTDFGNEIAGQTIAFTLTAESTQVGNQPAATYSQIVW